MRIVYFDEVKPNPGAFEDFLLAGLSLSENSLRSTTEAFHEVRRKHFAALGVDEAAEVHAKFVYHGKKEFKGKDLEVRLQLLADLLRLLEPEDVRLVYSRINVPGLYDKSKALEYCFTHFCERAHNTIDRGGTGLLIGDLDAASRNQLWAKFSEFRRAGTPWSFGKELPKFPDTVHFVDSRVCEMVQLADVYAFHLSGERKGYAAERLAELTKGIGLFPKSYKCWPPK